MGFEVSQSGDVTLVEVEGQLIVGNRQELKQRVLEQLEAGPRRVRAREALRVKKQGEADAERQVVTDLRKASDERTLQLKTNETRLIDLRSKLNAASSNKEFDIIKGQIDADLAANAIGRASCRERV